MIALGTIAFNVPWVVAEQIRLLRAHLEDPFSLTVFDNSTDERAAAEIEAICTRLQANYMRVTGTKGAHHLALNKAAGVLAARTGDYVGFLDHDVFPTCPTRLRPLIDHAGFYGVGQRHNPTQSLYLWPGFWFASKAWIAGRPLDFDGIRGTVKRDDGDTGSGLHRLFTAADWERFYSVKQTHGYETVRTPDDAGVQSWAVERMGNGDWIHLTNASGWLEVPNPEERERLVRALVAAL